MEVGGGSLTRQVEVGGDDDFVGILPPDPLEQLPDLELIWADPFDRGDGAVQDVVAALELPGALEGNHVQRLLDDADCLVTRWVGADCARIALGDVEAVRAEPDALLDIEDRLGERSRFLARAAE